MTEPKTMTTRLLNARLEHFIQVLLPLFRITEKELELFKKPRIRRILRPGEFPEKRREVPAYSFAENFFYFPLKDPGYQLNVFSNPVVCHEVGHFIHYHINPVILRQKIAEFETANRQPNKRLYKLVEIVAEYSNFILDMNYEKDSWIMEEAKMIYHKYGAEFLPRLSRISLEEAIDFGIFR